MNEFRTPWRATFTCACGTSYDDYTVGNSLICRDCGRGRETFQRVVNREVHQQRFSNFFTGKSSLVAREYREGDVLRVEGVS